MAQVDEVLAEQLDTGQIRADAAGNVRSIAWAVCRYADWRSMVARPGWDLLQNLTGLSRATIGRALRRLRAWGLLGVVETGSTWRTRGCDIDDREANHAAEYILCIPAGQEPVEISDPPSLRSARNAETPPPRARARDAGAPEPTTALWPIGQAPATRGGEQLQAAERIKQMPVFGDRSARYVRAILRPVFAAGWSPAQVAYALDHTPAGVAYWHTDQVKHPAAWAKNRLAAWQREDGTWITPPTQLGAGTTTDLSPAEVAEMRENAEQARKATDTAKNASTARAMLNAVLGRARKPQTPKNTGLGITYTTERTETPSGPYSADDPRARHATAADHDATADWLMRNAAQQARTDADTPAMSDGLDWLQRGLERRDNRSSNGTAGAVA